jgi:hypothetical protein
MRTTKCACDWPIFSISTEKIGAAGAILGAMSWFNEVASVFVRCDHVASVIVNANRGIL